jgi:hypothetical protein
MKKVVSALYIIANSFAMDLSQFLNTGGSVRFEVSVDDLLRFARYIIDEYTKIKKDTKKMLPEFGGIELAMEITGYAEQTIRNKVNKNQIPYKKVQGKIWFSRTELLNMINSGNNDNRLKEYMK